MSEPLPIVLIPGLNCSARLYAEQIPVLWRFGPVTVADHTRDNSMDAIAARILAAAPPRFALAGLSMGGYIALTIVRHAPERVQRLALLDTSARPDRPADSPMCRRCSFRYSFIATGKATKRCASACASWPRRRERRRSCASSKRS